MRKSKPPPKPEIASSQDLENCTEPLNYIKMSTLSAMLLLFDIDSPKALQLENEITEYFNSIGADIDIEVIDNYIIKEWDLESFQGYLVQVTRFVDTSITVGKDDILYLLFDMGHLIDGKIVLTPKGNMVHYCLNKVLNL